MHFVIAICVLLTFITPIIQLAIGFNHIVSDGQDANKICRSAPDLPLLLAIGGVFTLFFLGTAYAFLQSISSAHIKESDLAGKAPKILIGFISFAFGAITFIFFILIQMRVYGAYSNNQSGSNYCLSAVMHGALAVIILTFMNILLFISIFVFVLVQRRKKQQAKRQTDIEMVAIGNINHRF